MDQRDLTVAIMRIIHRLPSNFFFILFCSCFLIYACGGGDGGGNDDGSPNDPPTITGAILFDFDLNEDSITKRAGHALSDRACEEFDIGSINVDIYNKQQ
jgi:hypothetical protein